METKQYRLTRSRETGDDAGAWREGGEAVGSPTGQGEAAGQRTEKRRHPKIIMTSHSSWFSSEDDAALLSSYAKGGPCSPLLCLSEVEKAVSRPDKTLGAGGRQMHGLLEKQRKPLKVPREKDVREGETDRQREREHLTVFPTGPQNIPLSGSQALQSA